MPELFKIFFGALVRYIVTLAAGWLIAHGVLRQDEGAELIAGLILAVPMLLWSLWGKYKSRLSFLAGLQLPAGATEDDLKAILSNTSTANKAAISVGGSFKLEPNK